MEIHKRALWPVWRFLHNDVKLILSGWIWLIFDTDCVFSEETITTRLAFPPHTAHWYQTYHKYADHCTHIFIINIIMWVNRVTINRNTFFIQSLGQGRLYCLDENHCLYIYFLREQNCKIGFMLPKAKLVIGNKIYLAHFYQGKPNWHKPATQKSCR